MNEFCTPLKVMNENNELNPELEYYFNESFAKASKYLFKLVTFGISLPEPKIPEKGEAFLMQLITATSGAELLRWYLTGIQSFLENHAQKTSLERVKIFYAQINQIILPELRYNLCSIGSKHFFTIKTLKYQIISTNWVVNEVKYEYHSFVGIAKKAFEILDKQLNILQLSKTIVNEIWNGIWLHTSKVLLSAFGSVRSCNNCGRSLMVGDTRAISSIFTNISKVKISMNNVLEYINAFFYQKHEFENWIDSTYGRYKPLHIYNLVKTGLNCKLTKKEISNLVTKINFKFSTNFS